MNLALLKNFKKIFPIFFLFLIYYLEASMSVNLWGFLMIVHKFRHSKTNMDTVSQKLASISYFIGWLFHGWINMFHVLFFPKVLLINNNAILLTAENFAQHEICSEKSNTIKTVQNQKTFKSYRWNYEMNHLKWPFWKHLTTNYIVGTPSPFFYERESCNFLNSSKMEVEVQIFSRREEMLKYKEPFQKGEDFIW